MLTDEGYISFYNGLNMNKISDGTFITAIARGGEIINHVGLIVSASIKSRETPAGKPLIHKYESSLGKKCVWNYREVVGILSNL